MFNGVNRFNYNNYSARLQSQINDNTQWPKYTMNRYSNYDFQPKEPEVSGSMACIVFGVSFAAMGINFIQANGIFPGVLVPAILSGVGYVAGTKFQEHLENYQIWK